MNVINYDYNFERHVQLLRHQKIVLNQNKSFFEENNEEFLELLSYNVAVEQYIFWEDRFKVSSIIQTFLNKKISTQEFHDIVFELRSQHNDKRKNFLAKLTSGEINDFVPTEKASKFKGFLSSLYFECENLEMNWDEKTFYNSIQSGFSKFQKILNEE